MERVLGHHAVPKRGQIKAQIFRSLFRSLFALLVVACQGISSGDVDPSVQEAIALLNSCSTETVSDPSGSVKNLRETILASSAKTVFS